MNLLGLWVISVIYIWFMEMVFLFQGLVIIRYILYMYWKMIVDLDMYFLYIIFIFNFVYRYKGKMQIKQDFFKFYDIRFV